MAAALEGELEGIPLGRARALVSFMDEFISGLTYEEAEPGKSWLLRSEFLYSLAFKMQELEKALEAEDQPVAEWLSQETLTHWSEGYLSFAKECRVFRQNLLERGGWKAAALAGTILAPVARGRSSRNAVWCRGL